MIMVARQSILLNPKFNSNSSKQTERASVEKKNQYDVIIQAYCDILEIWSFLAEKIDFTSLFFLKEEHNVYKKHYRCSNHK